MYTLRITADNCDVLELDNAIIMGQVLNDPMSDPHETWTTKPLTNQYGSMKGVYCCRWARGIRKGLTSDGWDTSIVSDYILVMGTNQIVSGTPHTRIRVAVKTLSEIIKTYHVIIPCSVAHSITIACCHPHSI